MTLLGYLLVLTGVLCCIAAPASDSERPKDSCGAPQRFLDKELQGEWNEEFYAPGTLAQYSCRPGYIRLGAIRYVCIGGEWETIGSVGQCKRKSCGHPGDIEFGTFEPKNEGSFVFGAVVEYTCNEGYQMISKHRTRECSVTGWTNYRPECEEFKCSPPQIVNGRVSNAKPSYKDKETLEFSCENGYKPSATSLLTCTKNDWSPTPICEEIVCYPEAVKDGTVKYTKETYRFGDTVTLICKEGYQIEYNPDEPRKCTAHGWNPPLKCIRKLCSRPIPQNAYIDGDLSQYHFPMTPCYRCWFYYYCDYGFLSSDKTHWGTTYCTKTGWNPEPKCYKKCNVPPSYSINANIIHTTHSQTYIEGEKLRFQCSQGFKTSNGQTTGEMECHPDGYFFGEKCSKTCQKPNLVNGGYETNENVFDIGAYLVYKCEEGFISRANKAEGISQCGNNGWQPKPECRAIAKTCGAPPVVQFGDITEIKQRTYSSGSSVIYKCANYYKLEGNIKITCEDGEWEKEPVCREPCTVKEIDMHQNNIQRKWVIDNNDKTKKLYMEHFDNTTFECKPGYEISDPKLLRIQCLDGVLKYPRCLKEGTCRIIQKDLDQNFLELDERHENEVFFEEGETVTFKCKTGYRNGDGLTGTCAKSAKNPAEYILTYPTCEQESAV